MMYNNDHDRGNGHHQDDVHHHYRRRGGSPHPGPGSTTKVACSPATTTTTALRLNHDGVALLMSGGKDDEAIAILKLGLVCMKSEFSFGASCFLPHASAATATMMSRSMTASSSSSSTDTTSSSFFSPAGVIPPPPAQGRPAPPRPLNELSSDCVSPNPPDSTPGVWQPHFVPRMAAVPVYHHDQEESRPSNDHAFFAYTSAFTFKMTHHLTMLIKVDHDKTYIDEHHQQDVLVQEAEHGNSFSQIITSDILSATIVYNLALAYHMKALRGPPSRRGSTRSSSNNQERTNHSANAARRRALVLYDMCIKILKSIISPAAAASELTSSSLLSSSPYQVVLGRAEAAASDFPTTTRIPPALCIAVACCNNMAHLVYIQQDFDQWRTVIGTLQWFLCIYESKSSTNEGDFVTPFLDSDMEGFKWNSILVQLPITAKAA